MKLSIAINLLPVLAWHTELSCFLQHQGHLFLDSEKQIQHAVGIPNYLYLLWLCLHFF